MRQRHQGDGSRHATSLRAQPNATARVGALLARIEQLDPELRAFITVTAETALDAARACDAAMAAGRTLGPLHGLVIAIKDCIDIAATRGTWGSAFFADRIPARMPRLPIWHASSR